ncbi:MAG TPA: formate dehydrogenase accessory sulfurtransferase FdhD [Candidatus Acetothermia bacterium]|nr:formate dehydrogenase accessory sulfurtransferase FdhD [Candidatus Acetothermia bacterium]
MKKEFACQRLMDGKITSVMDTVATETPLSVFINGRHFVTAMISPQMVSEFVLGHLYSSGVIHELSEVEVLEVKEGSVHVLIPGYDPSLHSPKRLIVSGCGGSTSFLDDIKIPTIHSSLHVTFGALNAGMRDVLSSSFHRATGGVHCVGLVDKSGTLRLVEDVGRHNAVDKAIGCGLTKGIDFAQVFLATTGRISSEIVYKCAVANIPLVISRGAVTSLAIEVAMKARLTIIGFARGGRMNIYTWREKIWRSDILDR